MPRGDDDFEKDRSGWLWRNPNRRAEKPHAQTWEFCVYSPALPEQKRSQTEQGWFDQEQHGNGTDMGLTDEMLNSMWAGRMGAVEWRNPRGRDGICRI